MGKPNIELIDKVRALADGVRSSVEIAGLLGRSPRHIRKILMRHGLPRLHAGAQRGESNHQFQTGRRVNHNGYAVVTAPEGHPFAKSYGTHKVGSILEHRLVMEREMGRYLQPEETVDHIDGLTLHNHPRNLRLFLHNSEHLQSTITGRRPNWSAAGYRNMKLRHLPGAEIQRVDIHRQRTEAGATRLRQILLAALQLGIDSPYLLGSSHHLEKAGIALSSRSTIERALADLCQQWGWPPPQL